MKVHIYSEKNVKANHNLGTEIKLILNVNREN